MGTAHPRHRRGCSAMGGCLQARRESGAAMRCSWLLLLCYLLTLPALAGPPGVLDAQELADPNEAGWLEGRKLVFYAEDLATGERYVYGRKEAEQRHCPWSSFKIPNTLIALETGVASGLETRIAYDSARRPAEPYWPQDWKQDQTLASAFQRSAAWYYQDLALRIGSEAYRGYLGHFGYGNCDVPEGSDNFWLGGPLAISPKEQATFLRRLLVGQLEVSPHNIELLSQISVLKTFGPLVLHGKTGSGPLKPGRFEGAFEGWLVGWVVRPQGKPVVFATYTSGPNYQSIKDFRQQASERLLESIGALPTSTP